ncbi:aminoglycoside phosphotransferase family protein [Arthrobacter sp. PAMC25564]|uniref:phosphotransferase family protein n=1 Tax=Arthrobacter sp. PAMC25564 TaxID=2565366 RepID=UPI0010A275BB|nr:aminoglycoside phosphotransferase family protein [Arthrobacter sp. PAMC25564]QCB97901.1 aminoglycoside phosphotransferase family protein [Arthrobacter sp. PAMC25564]
MPLREADFSLACRDDRLPCLAVVLDDDLLSEVLGEPVRINRVRYKPGTSALVAFRRTLDGKEEYGWALTTRGNVKLDGRAQKSERRGGGLRLLPAAPAHTDAVIAVGGIEDDWALCNNLRWLADVGLEQLGAVPRPGPGLLSSGATVLRYKPERRVVLLEQHQDAPLVIKTAAHPAENADRLHQRLRRHGVPVLPMLGGADCRDHGTSASPLWGDRDLAASDDPESVRRAGEALARLHSIPAAEDGGLAAGSGTLVERQLAVTCAMVTALVPALELRAARVAARIRHSLEGADDGGPAVVVHGDFSADQVLVSGSEVRLIDFDRARTGIPEADLGSFAAVEEMGCWRGNTTSLSRLAPLLEGYVLAGGRFVPGETDAWAALRLFAGSVDPFRDRCPEWAADMSRHIDRAWELVP